MLCLAAYGESPADARVWAELQAARHAAAAGIARLNPKQKGGEALAAVRELLQTVAASGAADRPADRGDLALADTFKQEHAWPGLLAAMLLVPAWQWPAAPAIADVPRWLWDDYTRYLFQAPLGFCAVGQAESYAAHSLRRLEEFAGLAEAARGSGAVRAALRVYAQTANGIPLYFTSGSLRRHAELRGRLLGLLFGLRAAPPLLPQPRDGRRLRVGFINRHFSSQTETYTTLPTFEHLDPDRFEVLLFAHHAAAAPLEDHCRRRSQGLSLLPPDLAGQLAVLRHAALDVAVFGTNVTAVVNEVTQLALHRIAPLQVVNNSSCITTGLPEMDLYVSGTLTEAEGAAEHFSERLGLLPGPAHAFSYAADRQEPARAFTRTELGLPADKPVFVSAANYYKIIPEMRAAWAQLLADVPGSCLLVHPFNPNWSSSYPLKRFTAEFHQVLADHGVAPERLVISTRRFSSRSDVKELLHVGDIYLDSFPFGGVNSLIDPLEIGLPVVAWEGGTFRSRMGAALLRALGLEECIAASSAGYRQICLALVRDAARQAALKAAIEERMGLKPVFMDPLAASDAFGELLILAYDELAQNGAENFRQMRTPLVAAKVEDDDSLGATVAYLLELGMTEEAGQQVRRKLAVDPVSVEARQLMGRVLLAQGRVPRAREYLLAAVQRGTATAAGWRDLAAALHRSGQRAEATSALETALRLDQEDAESWFMLAEFAFECGHQEILLGVAQIAARLAPADPRTVRLADVCAKFPQPVVS